VQAGKQIAGTATDLDDAPTVGNEETVQLVHAIVVVAGLVVRCGGFRNRLPMRDSMSLILGRGSIGRSIN
jgi:hypothetical protein